MSTKIAETDHLHSLGYLDIAVDPLRDLVAELQRLQQVKLAVVLAHY
jgi:hypothetical protein